MAFAPANPPRAAQAWSWRRIPWIGGLFIAGIVVMAAADIVRGYQATVSETGRELDAQARVIAEQTTRSLQTVDRVLGHIVDEVRRGALVGKDGDALHAYLKDQAVGLVQIEGIALFDAAGNGIAVSNDYGLPDPAPNLAQHPMFQALRRDNRRELQIFNAAEAIVRKGLWVFPMVRRLETASGEFAGILAAGGRVEYFQQFYRDVRLDEGTKITLMNRNGTLMARHPPVAAALGKQFPLFDSLLAAHQAGQGGPSRSVSPVDGVDRFAALALVPVYPLAVIVTRDAAVALAPWRTQAYGTALRTLALGLLAAWLLTLLRRQFARLDRTRESLEVSRERFALAAEGSDVGIWDWHPADDRIYASARARELFGVGPGPEIESRQEWLAAVQIHPDDAAQRSEAIRAHLAGETPVYAGEYRVRDSGADADRPYRWIRVRGLCVRNAAGQPLRMAGSVADIDARRRAEEALRVSEERYALAMMGSTGGHWVWDVGRDSLFVSGTLNQLFGLPEDTPGSTREAYFRRVAVHPDDLPRVLGLDAEVRGGRLARFDIEFRIVMPGSGALRWILTRAQCFRDASDKVVRVAGVSVDVSERKQTEAALRLSEERFALAVAGSNDGILDWDAVNDRMYTSERAMRISGVESNLTTRTRAEWLALLEIHPDDRQRHDDDLRRYREGPSDVRDGEYRLRQPDGQYRWVRVRMLCVRDGVGRPTRLAGSVSDIDAYKRVEAALRESEERYALAMTGSNEGHWVWDLEKDQAYASARMNQILGLGSSEYQASYAEYWDRIPMHPDDRPLVRRARDQHFEGMKARVDVEYRVIVPASGELRWIHARGQVFRDANGKPVKLAGSIEDITQRKHTEEALRESEERLALATTGSNEGHWVWDIASDGIYASPKLKELFGMPRDLPLANFTEYFAKIPIHPDDRERVRKAREDHLEGKSPRLDHEFRLIMPGSGEVRWVHTRGQCFRDADGRPVRLAGSTVDATRRKRSEEALRQSEERFALAVAGSDDGVWEFDYTTNQAFGSRRGRQILGLPLEPEVQTLDKWLAALHLHPDDEPLRLAAMRAHLSGQAPAYEGEWRVLQPDGSLRWVRARGMCVRDAAGKPLRMAGSVSDIDARKRAEEALRQSQERYALAVAGSDDGVWDWDYAAGLAFESARARELQGLPPGPELQPIPELVESLRVHPDDAPRRAEGIRAHLAGETAAYECDYRVRHDDGQYRWIHVRALCIRDPSGKPVRMAGSVTDIDARKRAEEARRQVEEALRRSEERYQLAVTGSNEGLWDWDLVNDSLFLSERAQELTFATSGEPQRPRREWIDQTQYHPDDLHAVRQALVAHLRGETRHFKVEYRLRHHSGEWHWYRQRGVAVRDAQGRPTRMAGSMEDITDRKQSEAERERLEGQLRQAQKLEAIGTLAGGIAHDFNNILAAILGYGEMALKDAREGSSQRRHIAAAVSAGMRAKSLVERILAFSRSGMGERIPVHVQSVVVEALDVVAAALPGGITLDRRLDSGDAAVLGDPTQVHQVVMNLCANAAQAMKTAGTLTVTLERVDLAEPSCATCMLARGNYIALSVRDTGSGIAPHLLERIFDPFFTTKEVGVGTGLGLSLVHGIVTDLGGGIDVRSELGVGSTFTVYLPWQSCVSAPVAAVEAMPENGNGETILLVDDEEPLVRLGEEMIAELGYEPVGFTSSLAALATFRAEPQRFNAVLSDEAMPEMTGSELAQEIRKIRPDIPIVMMSGYVTAGLTSRARDAGVAEVLSKPLVSRDIARSLASALRQ